MLELFEVLLRLVVLVQDPRDVEALKRTAPSYLTNETASANLAAAQIAGAHSGIQPEILLAIAWHESRYQLGVIGPLVRGKRACGLMQQIPIKGPCPEPSILRDYVNGAQHLAGWIHAQRGDLKRALIGYAGGYALLDLCDRGKAPRTCTIANYHLARAKRVKRARELGKERPGARVHKPVPPS
jgi:hypothetical protein